MDSMEPARGIKRSFGEQLKYYRQAAGLSQERLAEQARLSVQAVSAYEQGLRHAPYRETVSLLAVALALSPEEAAALEATIPRRRGPVTVADADSATNVPPPLTTFIGRERELEEVTRLLGATRLLTLTGPGGTGKTRLALEVAAGLLDQYQQGVWLVELAPLTDAMGVPAAVAAALGVREEAGQSLLATLAAALRARRLLLVLDNCEHLLDAGAALVAALLRGCPQVSILATSREVLGIAGETVWRVPSLALPDAEHPPPLDALCRVEAVRLLVERALAVQPHFALTAQNARVAAQVCRRLDGIPLAIELAAARLRGLSIEALAARLDQRFRLLTGGSRTALPRQQTLQAMVDWSYGLLSAPEQTLFNRLAVFTGGFALEAAEAVGAGGSIAADEVLTLLLRLVDRSLVIGEETDGSVERYRLLETLRQYGRERLAASGEAEALYSRHFAHYQAVAEHAQRIFPVTQQAALDLLESERENLRQALGWALDTGEAQDGLHLAGTLGIYWWYRGHFGEGGRWLGALLAQPTAASRTAARARALWCQALLQFGTGWLAGRYWQGTGTHRAQYAEALAISREAGDISGQAWGLIFLGQTLGPWDYAGARAHLVEGMALATALGDHRLVNIASSILGAVAWLHRDSACRHWFTQSLQHSERERDHDGYARALQHLASVRFQEGDVTVARRDLEESLAVFRALRDRMGIALVLGMLGVVAASQGDIAQARVSFAEKHALWEQVGERGGIAGALRDLGWLARREGSLAQARDHYLQALELERDLRDAVGIGITLAGLGNVARDEGHVAEAANQYREALAMLRGSEVPNEVAACLEGLAAIAWAQGDAARAACLCGAAASMRLPDLTLAPAIIAEDAEVVAAARAALGETAFAALWVDGQALEPEEAVALALTESVAAPRAI
jgi:predicted ATPase/DNA-binding XRE family transcriptional regulator